MYQITRFAAISRVKIKLYNARFVTHEESHSKTAPGGEKGLKFPSAVIMFKISYKVIKNKVQYTFIFNMIMVFNLKQPIGAWCQRYVRIIHATVCS